MARRILLLITDLEIGGTPTVVRELAIRLNHPPERIVAVACLAGRGPVAGQLEAHGIQVVALGAKGPIDFRIVPRLIRLIRGGGGQVGFDTVLSFLVHANTVAAAASMACRSVRFVQSIQTTQPSPAWHWRLQAIVQRAADVVVVPSQSVAVVAQRWALIPLQKIVVIPNAVDVVGMAMPSPPDRKLRRPGRTVGFLGRLDPIKRIPDLIEAIALLDGSIGLEIFGDGSQREKIEAMISRLELGHRVRMHGAVTSPVDALARMDLLALPSSAEGFGLVLIEAMAAGVAVVATNVAGIRDVVRDQKTGLLVPVASPQLLAQAIRRVLDDSNLRARLVASAHKEVRERFDWAAVLPQYRKLLGLDTTV